MPAVVMILLFFIGTSVWRFPVVTFIAVGLSVCPRMRAIAVETIRRPVGFLFRWVLPLRASTVLHAAVAKRWDELGRVAGMIRGMVQLTYRTWSMMLDARLGWLWDSPVAAAALQAHASARPQLAAAAGAPIATAPGTAAASIAPTTPSARPAGGRWGSPAIFRGSTRAASAGAGSLAPSGL